MPCVPFFCIAIPLEAIARQIIHTTMAGACKGYRIVVGSLLVLSFQYHVSIAFQLPSARRRSGVARSMALDVLSPRQLQFLEYVEGTTWL